MIYYSVCTQTCDPPPKKNPKKIKTPNKQKQKTQKTKTPTETINENK